MVATNAAEVEVINTQPLAFGTFVAGTGSLTVGPNGARTASGGVVPLSVDPGQAAQFSVTGDASTTYVVSLPADGVVTLNNGSYSTRVNRFVSNPEGSGLLSGGGSQTLNVGATMEITAELPAGTYSGSFSVIVEYN